MNTLIVISACTLILVWLVMAAPIGTVAVRRRRTVAGRPDAIWQALYPLGSSYDWDRQVTAVTAIDDRRAHIVTTHDDRAGAPIERIVHFTTLEPGHRFSMRVVDDTALAQNFWRNHSFRVDISPNKNGSTTVTLAETDRYRGLAMIAFRYFLLGRKLVKLDHWLKTGTYRPGGMFEHPLTQLGMAIVSALVLWPIFGMDMRGLLMSAILTIVVALHEFGHMAAFRMMGHKKARMIFLPLLGGIAIGGRPYDRHFEVAFSALMGAGLSALLLAVTWAAGSLYWPSPDAAHFAFLFFMLVCGFFNLANLLPVWKFDGGQVLRQAFRQSLPRAAASSLLLLLFVTTALLAGFPLPHAIGGAGVVLVVSLLVGRHGVRPKKPLTPMSSMERVAIVSGLFAVAGFHAFATLWAWNALSL